MIKKITLYVVLAITAAAGASCGDELSQASVSAAHGQASQRILIISQGFGTLNPHNATPEEACIINLLAGSLLEVDPESSEGSPRYIGALAEALPAVSADGLTWTFRLRDNLSFPDGTPIDAETFVFSMRMLLDPYLGYETASKYFSAVKIKNAKAYVSGDPAVTWDDVGVKASGRLTLEFTLEAPVPSPVGVELLNITPVHPGLYEAGVGPDGQTANYASAADILGFPYSGPYKPAAYIPGVILVLEKNIYYPNAHKHGPERIEYRFAEDGAARDSLFDAGLSDTNTLTPSNYFFYDYKSAPADVSGQPWFVYINSDSEPLSDLNLRQALFWGVDRNYITDKLFGVYTPVCSYVSLGALIGDALHGSLSLYKDLPSSYAAGLENNGFDPTLSLEFFELAYARNNYQRITLTLTCFDDEEIWGILGVALRDCWMELFGAERFHLLLELKPSANAYAAYESGSYQLGMGSMTQNNQNVWESMAVWASYYPAKLAPYNSAEYDRLLYNCLFGELMTDYAAKAYALAQMEALLASYVPAIPLFQDTDVHVH